MPCLPRMPLELLGDIAIHAAEDLVEIFNYRDLGAETGPDGAQFEADHAAADHHEMAGHFLELQRAGRGYTMVFSSKATSTPGIPATSEPVAMTMFFGLDFLALVVLVRDRQLACAQHRPGAPRSSRSCSFLKRNLQALHIGVDRGVLAGPASPSGRAFGLPTSIAEGREIVGPASMNISDACSIALEGMQPMLMQVPRGVGRFSTTAVFRPSWAALMAQTISARPEPRSQRHHSSISSSSR